MEHEIKLEIAALFFCCEKGRFSWPEWLDRFPQKGLTNESVWRRDASFIPDKRFLLVIPDSEWKKKGL